MKMSDYAGSPLEVQLPKPRVGGWLRYICYVLTILGPLRFIHYLDTADGIMLKVYAVLLITSVLAGATTWAMSRWAFLWLRIHFGLRLLYGFFQIYLGFSLATQPNTAHSAAQEEFLYAGLNIATVVLLFLYFRLSSQVHDIFSRNI